MAPKKAADDDEDDMPPSSDDDEEKGSAPAAPKVPPIKMPEAEKDASVAKPLTAPSAAPASAAPSEKPLTPREKFREKSKASTPRENPEGAAAAPAAAAAAPAAADSVDAVGLAKDVGGAAVSELAKVRIPTKEERDASVNNAKQQMAEAKEAYSNFATNLMSELPPTDFSKQPDAARMEKYIDDMAANSPASPLAGLFKPVLMLIIKVCLFIHPWFNFIVKYAGAFWELLPKNLTMMAFGAALCYFGGGYFASIAAIEAFRTMGWERARDDIAHISAQVSKVQDANLADDAADDDGDGVADVDQISPAELTRRKITLTLKTIEEPGRFQSAIGNVWAATLAVLATLRIDFAATTAIALGIVDMIKFPILRILSGPMVGILGPELKHWCAPVIEFILAFTMICLAWFGMGTIGAFYAAIRGGRLFADGFFGLLIEQAQKGVTVCPGIVDANFDPNESVLDEIVGYIIAAQGLMFQLTQDFALPFPWNVLLSPLTLVEWIIRTQLGTLGLTT